jgi:CBS domain-containing protein
MRAGELCIRDVVTATEDESITAAAQRMAEYRVGDLIVIRQHVETLAQPIGIVTDRDLVVEVLASPERNPMTTTIADVMRHELVIASEDDDIEHVVAKMRAHSIRRVAIVDREGGLQGILSLDDVLGWMRDQLDATTNVVEHQGAGPQRQLRSRFDLPR